MQLDLKKRFFYRDIAEAGKPGALKGLEPVAGQLLLARADFVSTLCGAAPRFPCFHQRLLRRELALQLFDKTRFRLAAQRWFNALAVVQVGFDQGDSFHG